MKRIKVWWLRWRLAALDDDIEWSRIYLRDLEDGLHAQLTLRRHLISELAQRDCPAAALRRVIGR